MFNKKNTSLIIIAFDEAGRTISSLRKFAGSVAPTRMRPRFHWVLLNPIAATRSSRGTRSGSVAWNDGKPIAFAHPAASDINASTPGVASPVATTTAMLAAITAEAELVQICVLAAVRLQYRGLQALNISWFA